MKKLMMVMAMLALGLLMTAPAIAQVKQAIGQEDETGSFKANFSATQSGSNSDQCVAPEQFGNTGSLQNGMGILQYDSSSGKLSQGGSTFTFSPSDTANCTQQVQQSSAASG